MASLDSQEIAKMSDAELEKLVDTVPFGHMHRINALEELNRRQLRAIAHAKPHWTLTPAFWVAVLAMVFAAIAAWPVVREFFQAAPTAAKAASSLQPQSQPTPSKLPEPKKSASSNPPSKPPSTKPTQ
jgi:hypothetical protein